MSRRVAGVVLAALVAAALVVVGLELAAGARSFGSSRSAPVCTPSAPFAGEGVDATIQRVVLDGLDGAACELGATREELVLSLAPPEVRPKEIRWDDATIERAVRSGLERSIAAAKERGSLPGWAATILGELAERAPVDFLLGGGREVADVVEAIRSGDLGAVGDLIGRLDLGDLLDRILP